MCESCSHMLVTTVSKCPQSLISYIYFYVLYHSHFEDIVKDTVHVGDKTKPRKSLALQLLKNY